jgi:hypothetical protein
MTEIIKCAVCDVQCSSRNSQVVPDFGSVCEVHKYPARFTDSSQSSYRAICPLRERCRVPWARRGYKLTSAFYDHIRSHGITPREAYDLVITNVRNAHAENQQQQQQQLLLQQQLRQQVQQFVQLQMQRQQVAQQQLVHQQQHQQSIQQQMLHTGGATSDAAAPKLEFLDRDHALSYVAKIKRRVINEPERYQQFLLILQAYKGKQQAYQESIAGGCERPSEQAQQTRQLFIQEVLDRVSELFQDHQDLLLDFTYFLPDSIMVQARDRIRRAMQ